MTTYTYDPAEITDPAAIAVEDGGCVCTVVEPGLEFISPECPIHAHLLFEEKVPSHV